MQSMYYVCCCKQVSDITTTYFFGAVIFDTRVMSSWEYLCTNSFVCDIFYIICTQFDHIIILLQAKKSLKLYNQKMKNIKEKKIREVF